jgi:hypothetical protein
LFGEEERVWSTMSKFPNPTSAGQYEYLLRVYFGSNPDRLFCCISRAYRDMNRTLRGFAKTSESEKIRAQGSDVVRSFLTSLLTAQKGALVQVSFDDNHAAACRQLCAMFSDAGFGDFRVGQAQKWINMALKYVFVFGEERLSGYALSYRLAHIPLDNIILERLRPLGVPQLTTSWSRVSSYGEYMAVQKWVRSTFPDSAPLAVEFALWQGSDGLSGGL